MQTDVLSQTETIASVVHHRFMRMCQVGTRSTDWMCDVFPNPAGACAIVSFELHEVLNHYGISTSICINDNHTFLKHKNVIIDATIGQFSDLYHVVGVGTRLQLHNIVKNAASFNYGLDPWRVAHRFSDIHEAHDALCRWPKSQQPQIPNPHLAGTIREVEQFLSR